MEDIIRVVTPFNLYPCLLALSASSALFHGIRLRKVTSGQAPILVLKSINKGKSQGKSACGKLCMKAVFDWDRNRVSSRLKKELIRKKASFTTMPIYFDDVKNDNFVSALTEGFDEGDDYETMEREHKRRAVMIVSCNYFSNDDVKEL